MNTDPRIASWLIDTTPEAPTSAPDVLAELDRLISCSAGSRRTQLAETLQSIRTRLAALVEACGPMAKLLSDREIEQHAYGAVVETGIRISDFVTFTEALRGVGR